MATSANTTSTSTSTSTVGTSESTSSVFSSCRILDIADFEEEFSGHGVTSVFQYSSMSTQRVGSDMRYYIVQSEEERHRRHHFYDTCYLCKGGIRKNQEIYMYKGELPFCSEECRKDQIEMCLALERLHHQAQKKDQKPNIVRVDQNTCLMEMDSCTESGYGYDFIKYIIALVVG